MIVRTSHNAFRTDIGYPTIRVVDTIADRDAITNPQEGDLVYVLANGMYRRTGNSWGNPGHNWKTELDRLRQNLLSYFFGSGPIRITIVDGERYYNDAMALDAGYSEHKYAISTFNLNTLGRDPFFHFFFTYSDYEFVYPANQTATATLQNNVGWGGARLENNGRRYRTKIRFKTPFPLRFQGRIRCNTNPANPTTPPRIFKVEATGNGASLITNISYIYITGSGAYAAFLAFDGLVTTGDYEFVIDMSSDTDPAFGFVEFSTFHPTSNQSPLLTVEGPFGISGPAQAIHNSSAVKRLSFFDAVAVKTIRFYVFNYTSSAEGPINAWQLSLNGQAVVISGVSDGFFLVRIPLLQGIVYCERTQQQIGDPHFNELILAPNADKPLTVPDVPTKNVLHGKTISVANFAGGETVVQPVPRMPFKNLRPQVGPEQWEDNRNIELKIQGTNFKTTRGSTVWRVHVRRHPDFDNDKLILHAPTETRPPINVRIGCMRNGSFAELISFSLTTTYEFAPDWITFTQDGLVYDCEEDLDIQAILVKPNPPSNLINFASNLTYGGIFHVNPGGAANSAPMLLADHYNQTEALLDQLPNT